MTAHYTASATAVGAGRMRLGDGVFDRDPVVPGSMNGTGKALTDPERIAPAWLLRRLPNVLPFSGTSSIGRLRGNRRAAGISPDCGELR